MEEVAELRDKFDQLGKMYPKETSVRVDSILISGVSCYWFSPKNAVSKKIIVYLHGGAFVFGSIRSHESLVSHLSKKLQTKILFLEYALAPENPYPSAINDIISVYKNLILMYPGYLIDFISDSAGGGLLICSISEMLRNAISLPQRVVLISPWINLYCNNPSYKENIKKDSVLSRERLLMFVKMYIGNVSVEKASPEIVRISAFPPALILSGTHEILLDDSKYFYKWIKRKQQNVLLSIYENKTHVWLLSEIHSSASQRALSEIDEFLNGIK